MLLILLMIALPYPQDALDFGWTEGWLTGEQYAHILTHVELYCSVFGFLKCAARQHPLAIYEEPYNGLMYFMEGNSVGSEFGFPRVEGKKRYRWKKMNFTTELPKRQPLVSYIVASALKCEKFFPNTQSEGPSFRMHAVILVRDSTYVLCHVRRLSDTEISPTLSLRIKRERGPSPLKRPKMEHSSGVTDGLFALLEAAEREESLNRSCTMDFSEEEMEVDSPQKLSTAESSGEIDQFYKERKYPF